jgi:hypothetical protein
VELFDEGFFEGDKIKFDKGRNGISSSACNAAVTVSEWRFGKKYRYWSFWNTERLDRQAARAKAEAVVSAKLMLES